MTAPPMPQLIPEIEELKDKIREILHDYSLIRHQTLKGNVSVAEHAEKWQKAVDRLSHLIAKREVEAELGGRYKEIAKLADLRPSDDKYQKQLQARLKELESL